MKVIVLYNKNLNKCHFFNSTSTLFKQNLPPKTFFIHFSELKTPCGVKQVFNIVYLVFLI